MDDRVDNIIREWHERRPQLDFSPLEVVARLIRASHFLQDRLDRIAEAYGLSHTGDLDVLTDLDRAIALDPNQAGAYASRGLIHAAEGDRLVVDERVLHRHRVEPEIAEEDGRLVRGRGGHVHPHQAGRRGQQPGELLERGFQGLSL